jgi:hypothetical protein
VEPNAALLVIESAGLSPNLVVFWLVLELSQEKGMGGSTISGRFGRREAKGRPLFRADGHQTHAHTWSCLPARRGQDLRLVEHHSL